MESVGTYEEKGVLREGAYGPIYLVLNTGTGLEMVMRKTKLELNEDGSMKADLSDLAKVKEIAS